MPVHWKRRKYQNMSVSFWQCEYNTRLNVSLWTILPLNTLSPSLSAAISVLSQSPVFKRDGLQCLSLVRPFSSLLFSNFSSIDFFCNPLVYSKQTKMYNQTTPGTFDLAKINQKQPHCTYGLNRCRRLIALSRMQCTSWHFSMHWPLYKTCDDEGVCVCVWYRFAGNMERQQADNLLKSHSSGTYLIRERTAEAERFAISIKWVTDTREVAHNGQRSRGHSY